MIDKCSCGATCSQVEELQAEIVELKKTIYGDFLESTEQQVEIESLKAALEVWVTSYDEWVLRTGGAKTDLAEESRRLLWHRWNHPRGKANE